MRTPLALVLPSLLLPAVALAGAPGAKAPAAAGPHSVASATLRALKDGNGASLATLAHPKKGVRFSTYGQVAQSDVRLWPAGLRGAFKSPTERVWGTFDGSGEPMRLRFSLFRDFLWRCDYTTTPHVRRNPKAAAESSGNQSSDSASVYASAEVVEFYCPTDESRMWSSLRLAFEKYGGRWRLVGVVHDGWTI